MNTRQRFSGDTLRARRKRLKLSRDVVAFSIGVTTGTIANWETGYCGPRDPAKLAALAEVLECEIQDLFEQEQLDVA